MRGTDIGDVIVIEKNQVCGIVTDRDIVVRTVAESQDPATTLADICNHRLLTATPTDSVDAAVWLMAYPCYSPVTRGRRRAGGGQN
jgi:predicted transcriptional regulator